MMNSLPHWGGMGWGFPYWGGLGWGFILLLFIACTTDSYETGDGRYSFLTADFCMAHTSQSGELDYALIDDGDSLRLSPAAQADWAKRPDSLYRTLLYYEVSDGQTVRPYAANRVYMLRPSTETEVRDMPTDPLTLQTVWKSAGGKYLNIGFQLKTGKTEGVDSLQRLALACDSVAGLPGAEVYHLRLMHDQNTVPQYYSVTGYATIPLNAFPRGSRIRLRVPTYTGEEIVESAN